MKVYAESGRFGGWPANHGIWSWATRSWSASAPEKLIGRTITLEQSIDALVKMDGFEKEIFAMNLNLLHLGPSDRGVCWALTTYATGFASALMGREVIFLEKECVGCGDARCYIAGRTDFMEWSEGVKFAKEYYKGQDFTAVRQWARTVTAEARELIHALERERELVRALESQVYYLQEASNEQYRPSEMVGAHPAFQKVLRDAWTVAASDATVLIQGETGTGKELIARFIHAQSERSKRPLITVTRGAACRVG